MRNSLWTVILITSTLSLAACYNAKPQDSANIDSSAPSLKQQPMKSIPDSVQPITTAKNENIKPETRQPASLEENDQHITLQLGMPAKVQIYQNENLYQKQSFSKAGTYSLDTSNWPNGIYQVVIQSGGGLSQVVVKQAFTFIKPGSVNAKIVMQ